MDIYVSSFFLIFLDVTHTIVYRSSYHLYIINLVELKRGNPHFLGVPYFFLRAISSLFFL